ncbi:MAG: NADPH-dependent aldehyde reductase Ahr [Pseudanabaenaceae cyanobacterium]
MAPIQAYAAHEPGGPLTSFQYEPGPLAPDEVEIRVETCGICHSDLSMLNNEWGITQYPFVPGHEVVGTIAAIGAEVHDRQVGQRVGLGWYARSCNTCDCCVAGDRNLCPTATGTIVGRFGGFADRVRAQSSWTLVLPAALDPVRSGPLFCGGITVFNPMVQFDLKPTDSVGVVGVGGLGHLALQFLDAWGCEVVAFSSDPSKIAEVEALGADRVVNSRDPQAIAALAGTLDLILVTANADLDWGAYLQTLKPKGRLHFVGVVPSPVSTHVFPLIAAQKAISGSPLGSPSTLQKMLRFAARHQIAPMVEVYPFSQVEAAMARLRAGKPRYRVVLQHPS